MAAPIFWAAIVLILYSIPGYKILYEEPFDLIRLDKLAHFTMFFVQTILLFCSFFFYKNSSGWSHKASRAFIAALIYGAILEASQSSLFIQRTTDINDFIANSAGCMAAWILAHFLGKKAMARWLSASQQ